MSSRVPYGTEVTPELMARIDRAESGVFTNNRPTLDRVNLGTATVAPGQMGNTTSTTFIPFNPSTVTLGDPNHWWDSRMFQLEPPGTTGNAPRSLLRGPGAGTWNFSMNKDTRLPFLGEQGSVEFRAEFFNILNRANFAFLPTTQVFTGTISSSNLGPYTENPNANFGKITSTSGNSRQIQFALKVIF